MTLTIDVDLPADLDRFRLPEAVAARLQALFDRQDSGQPLTESERKEAEGLVNLSEFLTLLRLRAELRALMSHVNPSIRAVCHILVRVDMPNCDTTGPSWRISKSLPPNAADARST